MNGMKDGTQHQVVEVLCVFFLRRRYALFTAFHSMQNMSLSIHSLLSVYNANVFCK